MRVIRVDDVDAYLALVGPFLRAREAEHNLALGLLGRLRVEPRLYGFDPTFVVVEQAGDDRRLPAADSAHGVVLSRFEDLAGVDAVAAEVIDMHPELPGVVGPTAEAARFADAWSRSTGAPARIGVPAARPRRGGGATRASRVRATCARPGLTTCRPSSTGCGRLPTRRSTRHRMSRTSSSTYRRREADPDGAWLVWDDDGPVSLAAYGNPTPSGIRVGPVYTPPEHRGRGYATSLVAELTAERLAAGLDVLLPLHRPREPDLERDLRPDRLRAGRRLGSVVVPAA